MKDCFMKKFALNLSAVVVFAASVVASQSSAIAGSIFYTAHVDPQATSFNTPVGLNRFDTSLGTLTDVTISFTANIVAEVDVFNSTGSSKAFTNAHATIPVSVVGPDGSTASGSAVAGPFSGTALAGFNAFTGITGSTSGSDIVASSSWSQYEGSGLALLTFNFNGDTGTFAGSANNGVFFGGSATASGDVKVTYTYNPPAVPEPSTFAMMGLGGVGLAIGTYRRRQAAAGV